MQVGVLSLSRSSCFFLVSRKVSQLQQKGEIDLSGIAHTNSSSQRRGWLCQTLQGYAQRAVVKQTILASSGLLATSPVT